MTVRNPWTRLAAWALLALGTVAGTAQAAGTAAGTDINNSATLTYSVGGISQGSICSSPGGNSTSTCTATSFKVDNKINVNVRTTDVSPGVSAVPGSTTTLTFIVTNTGNSNQDLALSTNALLASGSQAVFGGTVTDSFDPTSCQIYDASNAAVTRITNLAPDTDRTIRVACDIPANKGAGGAFVNTDIAVVSLKATAEKPNGGGSLAESATNTANAVDVVFADGAGPDDSARDAAYSARSALRIQTAAVSVLKSFMTLCDPAGGADVPGTYAAKSIPGAYIQYTVTVSNAALAPVSASLTNLVDTLDDSKVTFDPDLIAGIGAGAACAAVGSGGTASGANGNGVRVTQSGGTRAGFPKVLATSTVYAAPTLTVNWASVLPAEAGYAANELKPGESVSVIFNVKIN